MKKNIAIIGVGALGRRHLQSMMELSDVYDIYAVEALKETLESLKKEFSEGVSLCSAVNELPSEIETVVIATASNSRRKVFEELISCTKVKNIIFEKVLFQKSEDYISVRQKLQENGIKAWVNCSRREWPSYQELKSIISESRCVTISISGGEWGLACNGIHMLDLIQYLTSATDCRIEAVRLLDGVVPSKRKGFYEVYGSVSGSCGKCEAFQITCIKESSIPLQIEITTENARYQILEGQNIMRVSSAKNCWKWEDREFLIKFQSQLTRKVIEEIARDGKCELPDFDESMNLHLKYIEPLMNHFERCNMEVGICPIT